jgi:hypothetical protein
LPHTEPVVERDHFDVAVERVGALEIEGDGQPALALGAGDVVDRLGQQVALPAQRQPAPEVGDGADRVLPGDDVVVADVDAEIGDAGGAPPPAPAGVRRPRS